MGAFRAATVATSSNAGTPVVDWVDPDNVNDLDSLTEATLDVVEAAGDDQDRLATIESTDFSSDLGTDTQDVILRWAGTAVTTVAVFYNIFYTIYWQKSAASAVESRQLYHHYAAFLPPLIAFEELEPITDAVPAELKIGFSITADFIAFTGAFTFSATLSDMVVSKGDGIGGHLF